MVEVALVAPSMRVTTSLKVFETKILFVTGFTART